MKLTQVTPANPKPNPRTPKMMARELLYSAMVRVARITGPEVKGSPGVGRGGDIMRERTSDDDLAHE